MPIKNVVSKKKNLNSGLLSLFVTSIYSSSAIIGWPSLSSAIVSWLGEGKSLLTKDKSKLDWNKAVAPATTLIIIKREFAFSKSFLPYPGSSVKIQIVLKK